MYYVRSVIVAFLAFAACCPVSSGRTFFVDPVAGSMDYDGSADHPWKTIQQVIEKGLIRTRDKDGRVKNAAGVVKGGDTILLRSGYHGEIYCRGAYNDEPVTIAAAEGARPVVRRVFFSSAAGWRIRGLTVTASAADQYKPDTLIQVVNWGGPSRDFIIEDNVLYSSPKATGWTAKQWDELACNGISVIAEDVVIRRNRLNCVNHGIVATGARIKVEHNSIERIAGDGIVCSADDTQLLYNTMKYFYKVNGNHDDGIQFHRGRDKLTPIRNAVVVGNIVMAWDNKPKSPLMHSPQGICNFDIPAINWRVENNVVVVQHHHGITIDGCQGGRIINNLAYNPYGGNFLAGIALGATHAQTQSKDTIIRNNIVDSPISAPGQGNVVDHNIIVKDPAGYFRDPASCDFHLKTDSPAIDAGSAELAPDTDADGVTRPQGPGVDVGPYEQPAK